MQHKVDVPFGPTEFDRTTPRDPPSPTAPPSLEAQVKEQEAWPVQDRCNCTGREINSHFRARKGSLCERGTCHKAIPPPL